MTRGKQVSIAMHSDRFGPRHMAVNVKVYTGWPEVEGATEAQQQQAYDWTVEDFWNTAEELALACNFDGVYSEGRMGGWAVPYYGEAKHSPQYPELDNADHRKDFIKFQGMIEDLLTSCKEYYRESLQGLVDEVTAERNESERIVRQFCEAM